MGVWGAALHARAAPGEHRLGARAVEAQRVAVPPAARDGGVQAGAAGNRIGVLAVGRGAVAAARERHIHVKDARAARRSLASFVW